VRDVMCFACIFLLGITCALACVCAALVFPLSVCVYVCLLCMQQCCFAFYKSSLYACGSILAHFEENLCFSRIFPFPLCAFVFVCVCVQQSLLLVVHKRHLKPM